MKRMVIIAATGSVISTCAFAQTPAVSSHPAPTPAAPASNEPLRQQMTIDMQKAGFTDVRVRPDSFLVQAKDKGGNPVTMIVDPNSVTEIVAAGTGSAPPGGAAAATFTTVPSADMLGSKVIGTDVHNKANQDIGTIKDVAYSPSGVQAYIVGVGGFLGIGDHDVAVTPSALHLSYDSQAKTWHATMDATADQLKAAPEFHYPS